MARSARHPNPAVDLRLLREPSCAIANVGTMLFAMAFYGMLLTNVLFLTGIWGYSAVEAGLALTPAPLLTTVTAGPAGRLADRFGQKMLIVPGVMLYVVGAWYFLTRLGTAPDYAGDFLPGACLLGVGVGLAFPSLSSAAVASLDGVWFATGSAINAAARQFGAVIGIAVVVGILSSHAGGTLDGYQDAWRAITLVCATVVPVALLWPRPRTEPAEPAPTSPKTVEHVGEWDPSQPLPQSHADAIQPNDAGSPTRSLGNQLSRGLKVAVSLAGVCAVAGVGLFLLLRADAGGVTVYSSLPLQGPQRGLSEDMLRGMRLALKEAGNKAGEFDVKFVSLDDSTAEARGWDSSAVIANATRAAADGDTAVYIGEQNSGASALSIPVLSSAKVPQISPSNTAVGLTTEESGADRGEPGKYYVGGFRNYVRLVPRDTIQGGALATLMKRDGCERTAIIHDREIYGEGLANNIRASMQTQGMRRVLDEPFESREPAYHRTLARRLVLQRADCVVFSGDDTSGALRLFKAVGDALPRARLYGADGLADRAFTDANRGGLPEPLAARMKLTVPALGPEGFGTAGKTFFARFRQVSGPQEPRSVRDLRLRGDEPGARRDRARGQRRPRGHRQGAL